MEKEITLKKCPFCAGEPVLRFSGLGNYYWVECNECRAMTSPSGESGFAVSAWQKREFGERSDEECQTR